MKTILIVDDFASVQFYHQLLLQKAGYRTVSAANGHKAMQVMHSQSVDLVMLDLLMPGGNGREFLASLRKQPQFAHVPAVIVSTETERSAHLDAADLAHCVVLQKPASPADLISGVKKLLGA